MKKLFLILIPFILEAQTLPTAKDISVYQGSYTVLSFEMNGNVTADSLTFGVKPDMIDSTARVINKHNTAGGGSDADIQVIYGSKSTVLVKLLTDDTGGLTPAIYYYDLWKDTTAIFYGSLKIVNSVTGKSDGIATRYPYYTVALDTPKANNNFIVGMDSDGVWHQKTTAQTRTILGIDTLSGGLTVDLDSLYTKTKPLVTVDEFITGHDTTLGWQDVLNEATQYCLLTQSTLYLPARTYMIKDTWYIGTTGFSTMTIKGDIGYDAGNLKGTLIYADFGDRPAINIQGARNTTLQGINIYGINFSKVEEGITANFPNDELAYIDTANVTYGRYNPYAGIVIDGYMSAQPDSEYYTNLPYGGSPSSGVTIRDCSVRGFVVGIALDPSNGNANGDACNVERTKIDYCTYGISSGGSQNRAFIIRDCNIGGTYTTFTNRRFGTGLAPPMKIIGGQYGLTYTLFNLGGDETTYISGIYAESIKRIGNLGSMGTVDGCSFFFTMTSVWGKPDAIAILSGGTVFNGCIFGTQEYSVMNIVGTGDMTFNNCKFWSLYNDIYYVGRGYFYNTPGMTFNNCSGVTTYWNGGVPIETNFDRVSLPSRIEFTPLAQSYQTHDSLYTIYTGADYGSESVSSSSASWVDDTLNIEVTAGEVLEGDIIYWQTSLYGVYQYIRPMLKVESVIGASVKASKLFDSTNYDYAYNPSSILIAEREWATNINLTGDVTASNDTIKNLSDSTVIQAGDFIKGIGLSTHTRVVSVDSNYAVISKNATATIAGVNLYYGIIKNIRPSVTDLSNQSEIMNLIETNIPKDTTGQDGNSIVVDETGHLIQLRPESLIVNGSFNDWTNWKPDNWIANTPDTTNFYFVNNGSALQYISNGTQGDEVYQSGATAGVIYGYSYRVKTVILGGADIRVGGNIVHGRSNGVSDSIKIGSYSGEVTASNTQLFAITVGYPTNLVIDDIKVWEKTGAEVEYIYTPHSSSIPLLNPTVSDTLPCGYSAKTRIYDSLFVYDIVDSICVQVFYRTDGDYNLIDTPDTLTAGDHTIVFDTTAIPAEAKVYLYFIYLGDSEAYLRSQLYWSD